MTTFWFDHVRCTVKPVLSGYSKRKPKIDFQDRLSLKAAYSVTMNIFSKNFIFFFKSFVKVELSYVFTIKMFSTAENCMEK